MRKTLLLIPAALADSKPARFFWLLRRGLLASYYRAYLRQLVHHRRMFDHRQPPVIVYSMGHVGSTSVYETLSQASPGINLFRITGLSDSYLHSAFVRLGEIHDSGDRQHARLLLKRLASRDYLRQRVRSEKTRWKLVTLVRLPVSRSISGAFYDKRGLDTNLGLSEFSWDDTRQFLLRTLERDQDAVHPRDSEWFESEVHDVFGIDVCADPFDDQDARNGYKIIKGERADMLLIRLEDLDRCWDLAFGEFLGLDELPLVRANQANSGPDYENYVRFIREARFPESVLDKLYSPSYVRAIYRPEEIEADRSRWS